MTILKSILLTLLLIVVFSITQIGFAFLVSQTDLVSENLENHYGFTIIISFLIAYLTVIFIFWRPTLKFNEVFDIKYYSFKIIAYLLVIVFGLQLLGRPFWDTGKIWDFFQYSKFENDIGLFEGITPAFYYRTFIILIISPIFEELFFRQFLLKKLIEKNSKKLAIIISSICFAIIHIETPYNLIPSFIFGLISSIIFLKTNKIIYSIILHFLVNLLVQILYVFDNPFDRWFLNLNFDLIYWIIFLIGAGITYLGTKKLLATTYKNNA